MMLPPTRIAFCITELDPGGAERALVELVTRLDRRCFEPAVFCLGPRGALVEDLERASLPVTCLGARRARDVGVVFRLMKALQTFRPTILQTWLYHANMLGRLAGGLARVPLLVSGIRVAEQRSHGRLWAERFTQFLVDAHVCVSQDVADFSIRHGGLKPARVHVIPNGVDAPRFASARPADLSSLGIPADSQKILFVGRLDPQKDPVWLLEAFLTLQKHKSGVHLILAGQGPLEAQLRKIIGEHHLEGSVHMLGWQADVPELLQAADVLVLPSRWEGMPNVVLEAFAAGTPVVATAVEGISEFIRHGETGFLVKSRDSDELAGVLHEILGHPDLKSRMAHSLQTLVTEKFTWEANCRAYEKLYRELLQELPPR